MPAAFELQKVKADIEAALQGVALEVSNDGLVVPKERLREVVQYLKGEPYGMDYVSCLSGVDYLAQGTLECAYYFYSMKKKTGQIAIKVRTDRTEAKLPSITDLLRGAEYQEREAYDLYGFKFEGHPDLRRILMWEGFQHYPMRKDYQPEDEERPVSQEEIRALEAKQGEDRKEFDGV